MTMPPLDQLAPLITELDALSPTSAGVLIALAAVPLLWGWKVIRIFSTVAMFLLGLALGALLTPEHYGTMLRLGGGVLAAVPLGFAGWYLYQARLALVGGIFGAALFGGIALAIAVPSASSHAHAIGLGVGILGFGLGGFCGWKTAPVIAILETSLMGSLLVGIGITRLVPAHLSPTTFLIVIGIAGIPSFLAGLLYQIRDLRAASPNRAKAKPAPVAEKSVA